MNVDFETLRDHLGGGEEIKHLCSKMDQVDEISVGRVWAAT